ncbi:hypothetical protein [Archangium primigenium]|uniref:hypothetical protein n=1 Tax=[Archangium] primigenium TaxID=2792470 RepID=UPI0019562F44|nr:hypothetical protein [Archangium primigenium]MBM7116288.1 hypothetical protein [Archangium primigenium]
MTPSKRRQWARVFISARRHGLSGWTLLRFSFECARVLGSAIPILLALRVAPRPTLSLPPLWVPRAVGVVAVVLASWGLLMHGGSPAPRVENTAEEMQVPEWLLTDRSDAGVIAKKMPSKRMRGQKAPPCEAPQVMLNDACWDRLERTPPCGDFYEQDGRCYVPLVEPRRLPTSVEP